MADNINDKAVMDELNLRQNGSDITGVQNSLDNAGTLPEDDGVVENIFSESGVSGLTRFGGFVYEEWLKDLQGRCGAFTYREMKDNDAVIGAFLYAIETLIRQVPWRVERAGDTPQDIEAQEFLESCMDDMSVSWHDTISEILTFLPFGWSYMELCYKKRMGNDQENGILRSKYNDGRIGWRKWAIRAQETLWRWNFSPDGSIRGMEQIAPPDYKARYIPVEKALLFRTKSNKNNPEGRSILRNAYRSWFFLKNIQEVEAIGIERDLAGFPIMWLPPEIMAQDTPDAIRAYASYKKIVTNIKRDEQEGLLMPMVYDENGHKIYDITMLSAGGTRRQFDTNLIIQRYEQRIAMTVMADFLMIGHEKSGSFALSVNKTSLFQTSLLSILQNMASVMNTYAVPRLFKLNAFEGLTDYPKLVHAEVEQADLNALSNFIQKVASVGGLTLAGDSELEDFIRETAHLPKRPDYVKSEDMEIDDSEEAGTEDDITIKKCGKPVDDRQVFLHAVHEMIAEIKKGR